MTRHNSSIFVMLVLLFSSGCLEALIGEKEAPHSPRDLEIIFASGKTHTTESTVDLILFARDASECQLSNDNQNWTDWEAYKENVQWTLSKGDGTKLVYYRCRNSIGEMSITVAATIVLDTDAPEVALESPADGQKYVDKFNLVFTANDALSPSLKCSAKLDNKPIVIGVVTAGKKQDIIVYASEGTHNLVLKCSDNILSTEKTVSFEVVKSPTVKLMINDGSGYTESRQVTLSVISPTAAECRFSNRKDEWDEWLPYRATASWELPEKDGKKTIYAQCRDSKGVLSAAVSDTITLDTSPPPYISLTINNGVPWTNSRNVTLGLYAFAASECRFSNDEKTWSEWEAYKRKKIWLLSESEGEKTVYYSCKKKDAEDIGTVSSAIRYSKVPTEPPSEMSITINGGNEYTSSNLVPLTLNALGAYDCRYREGNLEWTDWEPYSKERAFDIGETDGAKTIYYECRNDYGTATVYSRIYLDATPPDQVTGLSATASPYAVSLYWNAAKDKGSGVKLYQVFRKANGSRLWAGITTGLSYKDEGVVPGLTYQYTVQAVDVNNNYGKESASISVTVPLGE